MWKSDLNSVRSLHRSSLLSTCRSLFGVFSLVFFLVLFVLSDGAQISRSTSPDSPTSETNLKCDAPQDFQAKEFNIAFVSVTNLRADHLQTYGYSRATSPRIDRFAKKSIVFEDAFSHASWTLPVAISIFTSQYPFTHGIMNRNEFKPLSSWVPTLVDILKSNGYATAAFVGDRDYAAGFGLVSRFDEVYDHVNDKALIDWKRYGVLESTVPDAITWLRKNRSKRFFIFLQGYDTHCPFAIPEENAMFNPGYDGDIDFTKCYWTFRRTKPIRVTPESGEPDEVYILKTKPRAGEELEEIFDSEDVRHMIALYDGEIQRADRLVGVFLDELRRLGLDQNTIVVFLSEHGDMFGKHGRFMRGGPLRGTFYDDVLHVPLIVYHPKLTARRVRGLAQLVDIAPTILDILNLEVPSTFQGTSLRPLILDNVLVNEYVFSGSAYTPRKNNPFFRYSSIIMSIRTLKWKMIHERLFYGDSPEDHLELFDFETDPEELINVRRKNPKIQQRLTEVGFAWLRKIGADTVVSRLQEAPKPE